VSALERVEAAALLSAVRLGGGRGDQVGGALCVSHPLIPIPELNRVIPLDPEVDLDPIRDWFGGAEHIVVVPPEHESLGGELAERGYQQARPWMKCERGTETPPEPETTVAAAETVDPSVIALVLGDTGFTQEQGTALATIVGAPGWHCFVAWIDAQPAGMGALFVEGDAAWCGIGATRPAFRRRGAQTAVLAARIGAARAAGVSLLTTETGERIPERPASSYSNILRAGFREAYLRPNWRSPA
jgi:GNAT superfamily N-acetyltransferase